MCRKEMHSSRRLNHKKRCCRTSNVVCSSRAKSFVPGFSELSLRLVSTYCYEFHAFLQSATTESLRGWLSKFCILLLQPLICMKSYRLQSQMIFLSETKENKAYILKLIHNIILSLQLKTNKDRNEVKSLSRVRLFATP